MNIFSKMKLSTRLLTTLINKQLIANNKTQEMSLEIYPKFTTTSTPSTPQAPQASPKHPPEILNGA